MRSVFCVPFLIPSASGPPAGSLLRPGQKLAWSHQNKTAVQLALALGMPCLLQQYMDDENLVNRVKKLPENSLTCCSAFPTSVLSPSCCPGFKHHRIQLGENRDHCNLYSCTSLGHFCLQPRNRLINLTHVHRAAKTPCSRARFKVITSGSATSLKHTR